MRVPVILLTALVTGGLALPQPVDPALFKRQSLKPPPTAHGDSLPGTAFSTNYGVDAAIAAAIVWNFGRAHNDEPCYPESAVLLSDPSKPNPGTDPGIPTNTGDDCNDPGPWKGVFSPGNRFPNYISAQYCDNIPNSAPQWRVGYSIYYVHDAGHKHDWEWAVVNWKQPDRNVDWWDRDSVILSYHTTAHQYGWDEMITLWGDGTDWDEMRPGLHRHHPRVFPDFYKHANFKEKKTNIDTMAADGDMFRSNDWVHMADAQDMHHFDEIDRNWQYGEAKSTPPWLHDSLCHLEVDGPEEYTLSGVVGGPGIIGIGLSTHV